MAYTFMGFSFTLANVFWAVVEGLILILEMGILAMFGIGYQWDGIPAGLMDWVGLLISAFVLVFSAHAIRGKVHF